MFALSLKLGGLGICNPVSLVSHLFNSFVGSTEHLVNLLLALRLLSWIVILIMFLLINSFIVNS